MEKSSQENRQLKNEFKERAVERKLRSDRVVKSNDLKYKNFSVTLAYSGYEIPIVCYALTQMLKQNPRIFAGAPTLPSQPPDSMFIETGPDIKEKVLKDGLLIFKHGFITFIFSGNTNQLIVTVASSTQIGYDTLLAEFKNAVEKHNFYQGKCLKLQSNSQIVILEKPKVTFDDVIVPAGVLEEYKMNTVEFLTNAKLRSESQRRSVILYGPPGTGKTSMISATFNYLNEQKITTAYLSSDIFREKDIESVVKFCLDYLTPMVLCFEDIDLIGYSRESGHNSVIGPLLSVLNGIEVFQKPIVFVATTNRFDVLDSALTRPCRIDRRFSFDYPDGEHLKRLFKSILKVDPPEEILKIDKLTGAHIREIYTTAKILASKNDKEDYTTFIPQAIQIVKDNFYIGAPKPGFKGAEEKRSNFLSYPPAGFGPPRGFDPEDDDNI